LEYSDFKASALPLRFTFNELWGFKFPARQAAQIEASAESPDALYVRAACRRQTLKANADSLAAGANTKRNYELVLSAASGREVLRITNYELRIILTRNWRRFYTKLYLADLESMPGLEYTYVLPMMIWL
jgi:hypothetical protein